MGKQSERSGRITPEETALFCEQIAMLLKSGIMLGDGMDALCQAYRSTRFAARFETLEADVRQTGSLHTAVEKSGLFPEYMVNMVDIGEKAGTLEQVMSALAAHYEREAQLRRSIRGAVAYPLALMGMMAVLIAVLAVQVMPILQSVFENLDTQLSPTAQVAMSFGQTVGAVVLGLVAAFIVLGLIVALLMRTNLRPRLVSFFYRALPLVHKIYTLLSACRFADVMGQLLSGGFPMQKALELAPTVMPDSRMRQSAGICQKRMEEGASFCEGMEDTGLLSSMQLQMLRVGDAAGQLDAVLAKIRDGCAQEADAEIQRAVNLVEPLIVTLLAVAIGAILLSVMLPLAGVLSAIG